MANNTHKSDIFKFVALRPPVSIDKKNFEINYFTDDRQIEQTPVGKLIKTIDSKNRTKIPELAKKFIESNRYETTYPESTGNFLLTRIYDFVIVITKEQFTKEFLLSGILDILSCQINDFLKNRDSKTLLDNIWDRYYAFYILARTQNQDLDALNRNLRVFHLLKQIDKDSVDNYESFQNIISAKLILSQLFSGLPKPTVSIQTSNSETSKSESETPNPKSEITYKKIWNDLIDTQRAIEEVKNLKFDSKVTTETKNVTIPNKETGIEEKEKGKLTFTKSSMIVNRKSYENLHINTKKILSAINLTESNIQTGESITLLQNKLKNLYFTANNINDAEFLKHMPEEGASLNFTSTLAAKYVEPVKPMKFFPLNVTDIRASLKPLGVGDLKVVKQILKKYVAGEVAHIENVLRGESKERKHRVLDRTEDIFSVSNETEEETTKDTQSTERFELAKESEKTLEEKMSVQAGATISGSYGMVTFGAHGDFAYSTANKESNKSSSNFAREVIDKSISKVQKKTKEERTTKKLHEVEEINTHGIVNKDKPDHITGIYRWVDKYYDAQIYNYGQRMMLEFIIPEPSAFYEYATTHKPKKDIVPPIDPVKYIFGNSKWSGKEIITFKDINEWNYQNYIRDYNVQGITPPPPVVRIASIALEKSGIESEKTCTMSSKELIVPDGYLVSRVGKLNMSAVHSARPCFPQFSIAIGEYMNEWFGFKGGQGTADGNPYINSLLGFGNQWIVPVSINTYDVNSFSVNIQLICEITKSHYEKWQIETYEKIMAAYKAMKMEYEQKISEQEYEQGIAITGQNPRINREIEKTELKKHSIKMLMDTYLFGSFDATIDNGINPPDFDIYDAFLEGKTIQFFEQAFEWENMTYLFYPYFWARKEQWVNKSNIYDNDPLFTKFLQAGSARVVIPVRPGYNDVVSYYLQTGDIWGKDGNPPLIKKEDGSLNDLFISIADELRNQTDDLANATPEGESWEIVLPTTLVYLQQESDLPTFQ